MLNTNVVRVPTLCIGKLYIAFPLTPSIQELDNATDDPCATLSSIALISSAASPKAL